VSADVVIWPWWALIPIVSLMFMGFGRRRGWSRPHREVQVVEPEDLRVNELEARVSELENRLDFAERLLSGSKSVER
jgi:hypothetical protein